MKKDGQGQIAAKKLEYKRLRGFLAVIVCLVFLAKALFFFYQSYKIVSYPYEWSTMDGYYVFYGMRLLALKPIYFSYESLLMPFEYVPLYPAIIGILARVFGPAVWYERSFSLLCALGIATLSACFVNGRTKNKFAAAVAGLMFFGPAAIAAWYIVRGIDLFAAFLALLGIAAVVESEEHSIRRLAVSTAIFVLAFYAKQTTVFAAAAAVLFVLSRNVKKGMLMGISYAICTGVFLLIFQAISGGWFFENAFVTTSQNPYALGRLLLFFRNYFISVPLVFAIACIQASRGLSRKPDVWTLYFLFTLLSTVLAGKAGAGLSYFVPAYSATCICAGMALGDATIKEKKRELHIALLLVLLVQGSMFLFSDMRVPEEKSYEMAKRLDRHIKNHPGEILSERIDSFLVLNGRELNVEAVQVPSLIIRNVFDQQTLSQPIKEKKFSLVIYSGMYFRGLPDVRDSIFEHYRAIDRINLELFYGKTTFAVMVPR
jgi:hypothetical protein